MAPQEVETEFFALARVNGNACPYSRHGTQNPSHLPFFLNQGPLLVDLLSEPIKTVFAREIEGPELRRGVISILDDYDERAFHELCRALVPALIAAESETHGCANGGGGNGVLRSRQGQR